MSDLSPNWTTVLTAFFAMVVALVPVMLMMRRNHKLMNSRLDELLDSKTKAARAEGVIEGTETEKGRVADLDRTVKGPS